MTHMYPGRHSPEAREIDAALIREARRISAKTTLTESDRTWLTDVRRMYGHALDTGVGALDTEPTRSSSTDGAPTIAASTATFTSPTTKPQAPRTSTQPTSGPPQSGSITKPSPRRTPASVTEANVEFIKAKVLRETRVAHTVVRGERDAALLARRCDGSDEWLADVAARPGLSLEAVWYHLDAQQRSDLGGSFECFAWHVRAC